MMKTLDEGSTVIATAYNPSRASQTTSATRKTRITTLAFFLLGAALLAFAHPAFAQQWGLTLREAPAGGAEVAAVAPDSASSAAGLRAGDLILAVNGAPVSGAVAALQQMAAQSGEIVLRVSREGWEREIRLQARPAAAGRSFGFKATDLPQGQAPGHGALITEVTPGSTAAEAGLKPGDAITHAEGHRLERAGDLASIVAQSPGPLRLMVVREGWAREILLSPRDAAPAPVSGAAAGPAPQPTLAPTLPLQTGFQPSPVVAPPEAAPASPAARPGNKALVSLGDFQVKAATANAAIGDGLREMLVTSLHSSGNFVVVERMDIQGLAAEQALSRSSMARPGAAIPRGQMDIAEITVYGAVTEFEAETKGSGVQVGVPNLPFTFGRQTKTAHMAIDIRVVEVKTGRILAAQRITGQAAAAQTSVGASPTMHGTAIPVSLGTFRNTPMEQAIRDCIAKATEYIRQNIPAQFFRHN